MKPTLASARALVIRRAMHLKMAVLAFIDRDTGKCRMFNVENEADGDFDRDARIFGGRRNSKANIECQV